MKQNMKVNVMDDELHVLVPLMEPDQNVQKTLPSYCMIFVNELKVGLALPAKRQSVRLIDNYEQLLMIEINENPMQLRTQMDYEIVLWGLSGQNEKLNLPA